VARRPFDIGRAEPLHMTVSAGVACCGHETETPDALVRRADEALYAAKAAGRDRVVRYDRIEATVLQSTR